MATFTITTSVQWNDSSFNTRAGNDTYNINGGTLTIAEDTRYATNATATTGNIGGATISATLGGKLIIDGTAVRLLSYTGGSGNVPAIGTTISRGGVSGALIGVWSSLATAPTAAGSAMPASGFIKLKSVTGGTFSAGALTGITATASGADVQGWIEVVGVDGGTLTCPRLGTLTINGAWFDVGTTTGSANQTVQAPASLTNTYYPGVWIETAVGSNIFEFYTNAGTAATVFATDSIRGKVVWISAQGSITIAKTSFGGFVPASGLKIKVPNILLITCTSGAPTSNSYNTTPSSRFKYDTSSGGSLSFTKSVSTWYNNFISPYSISISNAGFLDFFTVTSIGSAIVWDNAAIGIGTNINIGSGNALSTSVYGGTISNSVFTRAAIGTGSQGLVTTGIFNFTFSNCKFMTLVDRTGAIAQAYAQTSGGNCTFTNCVFIGGNFNLTSVSTATVTNSIYTDLITGTTTSANPLSGILSSRCINVLIDGISFGSISNVHPYDGVIAARDSYNCTIRNIGTSASPLNLGTANACSYLFGGSGININGNVNLRIQRCYAINPRIGLIESTIGDSQITMETVWGINTTVIPTGSQNTIYKSIFAGGTVPTSFTAVYGTHFFDTFISSTAGRIGLFFNEPTTLTSSSVSTSLASGSGFTSTGSVAMATANDTLTYTWPHYILGYTSFAATAPTISGTNATSNFKYEYQIDKNDTNGFNGSYKNFYLSKTGGATTNGLATVTMTSTSGVAVGDRIYGTNITAGTRVLSIDSSTQLTLSANSTGTNSGLTFVFSALNGETSISATNGFKLMIKITCLTSNTSNAITGCYCDGTTDATSQLTTYPLDTVVATVTVLDYLGNPIQNARVAIYKTSDSSQLMNILTNASGVATGNIAYTSNIPIDIRVRKSSPGVNRYVNNDSVGTITSSGFSSTITLIQDSIASP